MTVVARNAFADLFLRDESGGIFRLDVGNGKFSKVTDSESVFVTLAKIPDNREEWFAEADEKAAAARGLNPNTNQCIGFSVPLVFAQAGSSNTPYIVDIYDHVSFLGDLHRQISSLPNGARVRLQAKR